MFLPLLLVALALSAQMKRTVDTNLENEPYRVPNLASFYNFLLQVTTASFFSMMGQHGQQAIFTAFKPSHFIHTSTLTFLNCFALLGLYTSPKRGVILQVATTMASWETGQQVRRTCTVFALQIYCEGPQLHVCGRSMCMPWFTYMFTFCLLGIL